MNPQLQTVLNAATSFDGVMQDERDRVEVYLLTQYLGVTDSLATIMANIDDMAQLSPEQQQMVRLFALAKNKGLDTNVAGLRTVVNNNLGTLPPGWVQAAKTYILLRGLSVL